MALLPLTKVSDNERALEDFRVYNELSGFLAFQHLQRRSGSVLPELPAILGECNMDFSYRHYDTQFSPLQAAKELMGVMDGKGEDPHRIPFAVLGAASSTVSQAVAVLGAALELPQISSSSSASELDEYPFFARTVGANEGTAAALIVYLQHLQTVRNAANLML